MAIVLIVDKFLTGTKLSRINMIQFLKLNRDHLLSSYQSTINCNQVQYIVFNHASLILMIWPDHSWRSLILMIWPDQSWRRTIPHCGAFIWDVQYGHLC